MGSDTAAAPVCAGSPTGGTAVRLTAPGTLLKTGTTAAGKQIITVHKGAAATSQPQIVTLVKTTQGVTLATVRVPLFVTSHVSI